jgi:hypothetical protein
MAISWLGTGCVTPHHAAFSVVLLRIPNNLLINPNLLRLLKEPSVCNEGPNQDAF